MEPPVQSTVELLQGHPKKKRETGSEIVKRDTICLSSDYFTTLFTYMHATMYKKLHAKDKEKMGTKEREREMLD